MDILAFDRSLVNCSRILFSSFIFIFTFLWFAIANCSSNQKTSYYDSNNNPYGWSSILFDNFSSLLGCSHISTIINAEIGSVNVVISCAVQYRTVSDLRACTYTWNLISLACRLIVCGIGNSVALMSDFSLNTFWIVSFVCNIEECVYLLNYC